MSRMYPGETWAEAVETTHNDKELTKVRNQLWGRAPQLDDVEKAKRRFGDLRRRLEESLERWVDYKAQPEDLKGVSETDVVLGFRSLIEGAEVSSEIQGIFNVALEKRPEAKELWTKVQEARAKLEKVKEG